MMDLACLRDLNRKATRRSTLAHALPVEWKGQEEGFRMPFIGDRTPKGFKQTGKPDLFCDTTGCGLESEPALTTRGMFAEFEIGKFYGITESGQFQSYVREYVKTTPRTKA